MKEIPEIARLRSQLANLKSEADKLNEQAAAWRDLAMRSGADQVDQAARQLIAGNTSIHRSSSARSQSNSL